MSGPRPVALIADPDDPRHGTPNGAKAHYKIGERACDACKAARRAEPKRNRKRKPTGNPPGRPPILLKAATEDVDEVVIERHLQGRACPANTAERLEIVRIWFERGRPRAELEELVAWNVYRYIRVLRDAA